jgi:hypothetical protein
MGLDLNVATISLLLLLASTANAASRVFNVRNYGAKSNSDITQVCMNDPICIHFPYDHVNICL